MSARIVIATSEAPLAIGPYSQALKSNGLLFVSGQIALQPDTQQLVSGGIEVQTERALRNVEAILKSAGANLGNVVRCVVYLTTMEHFAAMNSVYELFFEREPPARTTIAVSGLPLGSLIEIEATALASRAAS
jgi:2-iminobutanoate/2-iminopropanoate deaminase